MSQAIDYYIGNVAQYQKAYINSEQYRFKRLKREIGQHRVIDLTHEIIRSFIGKRLTKVKPSQLAWCLCLTALLEL